MSRKKERNDEKWLVFYRKKKKHKKSVCWKKPLRDLCKYLPTVQDYVKWISENEEFKICASKEILVLKVVVYKTLRGRGEGGRDKSGYKVQTRAYYKKKCIQLQSPQDGLNGIYLHFNVTVYTAIRLRDRIFKFKWHFLFASPKRIIFIARRGGTFSRENSSASTFFFNP